MCDGTVLDGPTQESPQVTLGENSAGSITPTEQKDCPADLTEGTGRDDNIVAPLRHGLGELVVQQPIMKALTDMLCLCLLQLR